MPDCISLSKFRQSIHDQIRESPQGTSTFVSPVVYQPYNRPDPQSPICSHGAVCGEVAVRRPAESIRVAFERVLQLAEDSTTAARRVPAGPISRCVNGAMRIARGSVSRDREIQSITIHLVRGKKIRLNCPPQRASFKSQRLPERLGPGTSEPPGRRHNSQVLTDFMVPIADCA